MGEVAAIRCGRMTFEQTLGGEKGGGRREHAPTRRVPRTPRGVKVTHEVEAVAQHSACARGSVCREPDA